MNQGNLFLILMDLVGMGSFLLGTYFAWFNYKKTGHSTLVWFLISMGMVFGSLFSLANVMELASIYPIVAEDLKSVFLTGEVVSFSFAAYTSVKHMIKPL
ncbi:MAG: hypothetical protein ABEK36_02375 [Candidatus Aenigmatarchaeota archaeon]